jgi:mevalonate pyrophosphate decarboxylase
MALRSWESSPEKGEIKKSVAEAGKRQKTVETDTLRLTGKLKNYKKETLAKLIQEARKAQSAAIHRISDAMDPFAVKYKAEIKKQHDLILAKEKKTYDEATAEARKAYEAATKSIETEYKLFSKQCDQDVQDYRMNPNLAPAELADAYDNLIALLNKELEKAAKEKPPDAGRKI